MERRLTPILGWSSWNEYAVDINEQVILNQIDAVCELGLDKLGYEYINIDDGWMKRRGADGKVITDTEKFPHGMKYIADYAHQKGVKAGIYSDAGCMTCASQAGDDKQGYNTHVGLYEYEKQDLRTYFADWKYDFIKIDWCGGVRLGLDRREQYTKIGKVINELEQELDRDIVYNVCAWRFPGAWVKDVADSWRTSGDICARFDSVVEQLEKVRTLAQYSGPGHVNDLDMMEIGRGMTDEEDKMHFSMWCMMSSPILLAMDLKKIRPETLAIVSNKELIDIQQDKACLMARSLGKKDNFEVWIKNLGSDNSDEKAIAVINYADKERSFRLNKYTPAQLGFKKIEKARDLWAHEDIEGIDGTFTVPAHGVLVLKVKGEAVPVDYSEQDRESYVYDITEDVEISFVRTGAMMHLQQEDNAVILDVRSQREHLAKAPQGSLNIHYTEIASVIPEVLPDKERAIVTYCTRGKRATQARNTLKDLGYKYVYVCIGE